MKRDIIIIEDKAVSVTGNDVWMTAGEIAGLFHTGVPAVNAAIKAILKADVLSDYEVCRYIQLENGLYADVYSLEIIIPVAFRLNTYCTHVFRTWLVCKVFFFKQKTAYEIAQCLVGSEMCIRGSRIHFSRQNNARSLAACMNSGIGSPGAVDLHLISYAVFQRLFQNPLYRPICI